MQRLPRLPIETQVPGLEAVVDAALGDEHTCALPGDGTRAHDWLARHDDDALLFMALRNAQRALARGITTIRDLASDTDVGLSHRDRANRGAIVSPRVILAGFIEGPGAWAGPSDVIVRTEDEARAWVARYDSLGYKQIKLYNIVHPDLVPTIAAEAHRRGLRRQSMTMMSRERSAVTCPCRTASSMRTNPALEPATAARDRTTGSSRPTTPST